MPSSIIYELEDAISKGSSQQRVETLRRVTDLFLHDAPRLSDSQIEVFDEVIGRLADEIEVRARAELSRRLAPIANAPTEVVIALAKDDAIAVAGPILSLSKRLTDDMLVEIASTKSQDHLLAISGRSTIAPAVTDVLVDRGNQAVVRWVAGNAGAKFSEQGLNTLVQKSSNDDVLAEHLGKREDIDEERLQALMAVASDKVRKRLMASGRGLNQEQVTGAVYAVTKNIEGDKNTTKYDYGAAMIEVESLASQSLLNEAKVLEFAKAKRFEESVCCLSKLCNVPLKIVDRLINGDSADPVLILARAANLSWPTARAILTSRVGQAGSSASGLEAAQVNFDKLTLATAQRVIRFWQVREATMRG